MKEIQLIHIYYGSSGNSGLYINQIIRTLEKYNYEVTAFLNYYYIFDLKKLFNVYFKYSENMKPSLMRKIIRYFELWLNNLKVYHKIKIISSKYKKIIVNYSLNETFIQNYFLLKKLKKIKNLSLGITVHDALAFSNNYSKLIMKTQEDILKFGDFYITHNHYSKNILIDKYNIEASRVYIYRFPLMDLNLIKKDIKVKSNLNIETTHRSSSKNIEILFIGFLRIEKGVEFLINTWKSFQAKSYNINLKIVGRIPHNLKYDFKNLSNFELIEKYVNDNEFVEYINNSDYVILPYLSGTNSGILSTVSSLMKPTIVSNIQMFAESEFVNKELIFEANNITSLENLLTKIALKNEFEYKDYIDYVNTKVEDYNNSFQKELINEYQEIISNQSKKK